MPGMDISEARDGSVRKLVMRVGEGTRKPEPLAEVRVKTVVKATNGHVFHEDTTSQPYFIGDGMMPPLLEQCVCTMTAGEHSRYLVASDGFGLKGCASLNVPAGTPVVMVWCGCHVDRRR